MLKTSIIHVDSEVMDLGMIWVLGSLGLAESATMLSYAADGDVSGEIGGTKQSFCVSELDSFEY